MKTTGAALALLGFVTTATLVQCVASAETIGIPVQDQYMGNGLLDCYKFWHGGVYYAINIRSPAEEKTADLIDHAIANQWTLDIKIWSDTAPFDQDFYPRATACGGGNTISKFAYPVNVTVKRYP